MNIKINKKNFIHKLGNLHVFSIHGNTRKRSKVIMREVYNNKKEEDITIHCAEKFARILLQLDPRFNFHC